MVDWRFVDGKDVLPADDDVEEDAAGELTATVVSSSAARDLVDEAPARARAPVESTMTFASSSSSSSTGWPARRRCSWSSAGLSLIFGVTRIVNFAHGSLYMLGLYGAYSLIEALGRTPAGLLDRGACWRRSPSACSAC